MWCIEYTMVRSAPVEVTAGVVYYGYYYTSLPEGGGYVGLGTDWDWRVFGAECFLFFLSAFFFLVGSLIGDEILCRGRAGSSICLH